MFNVVWFLWLQVQKWHKIKRTTVSIMSQFHWSQFYWTQPHPSHLHWNHPHTCDSQLLWTNIHLQSPSGVYVLLYEWDYFGLSLSWLKDKKTPDKLHDVITGSVFSFWVSVVNETLHLRVNYTLVSLSLQRHVLVCVRYSVKILIYCVKAAVWRQKGDRC